MISAKGNRIPIPGPIRFNSRIERGLIMGLDISHDAFSGGYMAFNRLRSAIVTAMGGSYPPHDDKTLERDKWYWGDGYGAETHPGLMEFLAHSDCDGEISPELAGKAADEIEALLPKIPEGGGGHLERVGGYRGAARVLIEGFRRAAAAGEQIEFH